MKKLIAIMLLNIHLFNIGGQLAFHEYLVYQSDKLFNEQIGENHYNIDDLTEIRVPANMPGITDWKDYENLSGRIQFKNSAYNYVKIRMTRNTIYLVCIPNYATTHLSDRNIIYARQMSDIPVPKKDHVPFGKMNLAAYNYQAVYYKFSMPLIRIGKTIDCDQFFYSQSPNQGARPAAGYENYPFLIEIFRVLWAFCVLCSLCGLFFATKITKEKHKVHKVF